MNKETSIAFTEALERVAEAIYNKFEPPVSGFATLRAEADKIAQNPHLQTKIESHDE